MNTTITLFTIPLSYGILLTYSLLFFAIFALAFETSAIEKRTFVQRTVSKKLAAMLACASIVSALVSSLITIAALISIGLLALCLVLQSLKSSQNTGRNPEQDKGREKHWNKVIYILLFVISIMMMLHIALGFYNPKLLNQVNLSTDSTAYSLYLNFDKGILAFALLWFISKAPKPFAKQRLFSVMAVSTLITFVLAVTMSVIAPSLKLPAFLPIWLLTNILIACTVEEAFFRGLIQQPLTHSCVKRHISPLWAVGFVGVLFGLAHFGGGPSYMLLATIIGSAYGYSYYLTGQLRYAIGFHCGFNLIHLIFFTYPQLV